ncbi:MAG: DinB family protein [Anaerolineae bacterium]|nr:DinB family protein [Anaerolineae bacterium]
MLTPDERRQRIDTIRHFPDVLENAVSGLSYEALSAHPLAGEWSVQQNVHHLVDAHMNGTVRLKLILTSNNAILVRYDQDKWAMLPDMALPIDVSLNILRGLHQRWCVVWDSIRDDQWALTGNHTEDGPISIDDLLVIYSDHCFAHLDQIKRTLAAQK